MCLAMLLPLSIVWTKGSSCDRKIAIKTLLLRLQIAFIQPRSVGEFRFLTFKTSDTIFCIIRGCSQEEYCKVSKTCFAYITCFIDSLLCISSLFTLNDEKPGSLTDHNKIRFTPWLLFHLYLKRVKAVTKYFIYWKGIVVNNSSTQIHVREFLVIFLSFAFIDLWLYLFQV